MLLARRTPNDSLVDRRTLSDLDRFFTEFWGTPSFSSTGPGTPAADIVETENEYQVAVELPGLNKDDFKVTVQDGILYLTAEKKSSVEQKDATYHRRERTFGKVERRFRFADDIVADGVSAIYKDGVLVLTLPKAEEAKPRSIDVKVQ